MTQPTRNVYICIYSWRFFKNFPLCIIDFIAVISFCVGSTGIRLFCKHFHGIWNSKQKSWKVLIIDLFKLFFSEYNRITFFGRIIKLTRPILFLETFKDYAEYSYIPQATRLFYFNLYEIKVMCYQKVMTQSNDLAEVISL